MAEWKPVSNEVEERVANIDLKRDKQLDAPIHYVCVDYQNHAFILGNIDRQDRFGKALPGRRGRVARFYNGHFTATTEAERDYCDSKPYIYREPDDGFVFTHPKGFATRNHDCFQAYLAKMAS